MVCECASLWPWKVHAVRARYRWSCIDPETEAVIHRACESLEIPPLQSSPLLRSLNRSKRWSLGANPASVLIRTNCKETYLRKFFLIIFFSPTRFCWYAVKSAFLENAHASPQQSAVSFINLMQTRVLKFRERTLLSCTVQVALTRMCNSRV